MNIRNYIITDLLSRNYRIYVSICDESFCVERNGVVGSAIIILTTKGSNNRILLDLRRKKDKKTLIVTNYTYIIGFEEDTKNIWLIPVDDIADNRTLNMSDSKNHYLLLEHHPSNDEPTISALALREAVQNTIAKMHEKDKTILVEHNQKEQIDNILNEGI